MSRELERCSRSRSLAARATYDPEWLARQRRFEAAAKQARSFERATDPRYRGSSLALDGDNFVGDLVSLDGSVELDVSNGPDTAG